MVRFGFTVKTDKDVYQFFIIDYNVDTINTDNQGVYVQSVVKQQTNSKTTIIKKYKI